MDYWVLRNHNILRFQAFIDCIWIPVHLQCFYLLLVYLFVIPHLFPFAPLFSIFFTSLLFNSFEVSQYFPTSLSSCYSFSFFIFFHSTRLSHSPSHILSLHHIPPFSLSVSFYTIRLLPSFKLLYFIVHSPRFFYSIPLPRSPSHLFFQNSSLPIHGPTGEKGRELNQITRDRKFEFLVGDKRWLSRDAILGWTEGFVVILTSEVMKV